MAGSLGRTEKQCPRPIAATSPTRLDQRKARCSPPGHGCALRGYCRLGDPASNGSAEGLADAEYQDRPRNGLDCAATLHKSAPDVPSLLATASPDEIGADPLVAAEISEVVHRLVISAEIASALARCLTVSEILVG